MLASMLLFIAGLVSLSTAGYVLEDDYEISSFFSMFDFFTGGDPTNGYVSYVDQTTAQNDGLISIENGAIYMGVDHTNVATGAGRTSVRLTSQKSYNHGLVILDLAHMPGGICGTWPAFWMVGPNWPAYGEIDIIEGVNSQASNDMTLHTASGCGITNNGMFTGSMTTSNCYVDAPGQSTNAGCQIGTTNTETYGAGFNSNGGGVYATEWTSESINIYFFPRSGISSDISSGNPDPTTWGTALASFSGGCEIDTFFNDLQIVFDTTFCGDWAGAVWSTDATCSPQAASCQAFVENNPSAFENAYWSVNSLKVYTSSGATSSAIPSSTWPAPEPTGAPVGQSSWSGAPIPTPPALFVPSASNSTASALQESFFTDQEAAPTSVQAQATTSVAQQPILTSSPTSTSVTVTPGVPQSNPQYEIISTMQINDFPSAEATQPADLDSKRKRKRMEKHLAVHQKRGLRTS